jgi:hypothetical protein
MFGYIVQASRKKKKKRSNEAAKCGEKFYDPRLCLIFYERKFHRREESYFVSLP